MPKSGYGISAGTSTRSPLEAAARRRALLFTNLDFLAGMPVPRYMAYGTKETGKLHSLRHLSWLFDIIVGESLMQCV